MFDYKQIKRFHPPLPKKSSCPTPPIPLASEHSMTSQIEQPFSSEFNKHLQNFEEDIDSIREEEQKDNKQIEALYREIKEIKEMLKDSNNNR
jgi:hypothetical protein